jgi:hypothetical protein
LDPNLINLNNYVDDTSGKKGFNQSSADKKQFGTEEKPESILQQVDFVMTQKQNRQDTRQKIDVPLVSVVYISDKQT